MADLRRSQYRHFIDKCSLAGKRVLEVGCGQGEFLEMLKGFNVHGFGIENNQQLVDLATKKGLSVYRDFAGDGIHTLPGAPYDAFMQFNFIEHQPDPNGMVRCIRENLVPMGVGLVTAPSFEYIRNDCVYEVMRDHLAYYSERTLSFLFEKNGFDVLERGIVNKDTVYVVVRRQEHLTRDTFRTNYRQIKDDLNLFEDNMTEDGRRLAFWGASHQCFTAASFLNRPDKVESIVDSAKFKQGKFSPASHIPIVAPEQFFASPSDALLILAPGYTDEIAATVTLHTSAVKLFALRSDKIEELN
jgi:2-polyprenyl-3-methyl-5-hydroxy-6-metoxy-1,4-benzoquinol methylase